MVTPSTLTHPLHTHGGLEVQENSLTGHQLQPRVGDHLAGLVILHLTVQLALGCRQQLVGEGGCQGNQALGEELVTGLQQADV